MPENKIDKTIFVGLTGVANNLLRIGDRKSCPKVSKLRAEPYI